MAKKMFPKLPLKQPLSINSPANPDDVLGVKLFLYQRGLYDIPDYGLTPYPDEKMFSGIRTYQKKKGLSVDGVMNVKGETQETMRKDNIESEELLPPTKNIPGTNIPDEGVPDGTWPHGKADPNGPNYERNSKMDEGIILQPLPLAGPNMPEWTQFPPPPIRYPRKRY